MAMNQIDGNLWLGAIASLSATKTMKRDNVTHILSLITPEIPGVEMQYASISADFVTKRIDIDDIEDENIMQYFDETNAFIDEGLKSGGILVHCMAGVSRSATVVCAYLMQKYLWNRDKTIEFLKSKRKVVNPNSAFLEQLQVYFNCGFQVSTDRPEYRMLLLQQQAESSKFTRRVSIPELPSEDMPSNEKPLDDPTFVLLSKLCYRLFNHAKSWDQFELIIQTNDGDESAIGMREIPKDRLIQVREKTPKLLLRDTQTERDILLTPKLLSDGSTELRCKKCRQVLSSQKFLLSHNGNRTQCTQFFTEPLTWMKDELEKGELEGKLACPKCSAKVGSYHWQGSKCSCGEWIVPAIGLQKAKVDEMAVSRARTAKA